MSNPKKLTESGKVWCDRASERFNFLEEDALDGTINLVLELRVTVDSDGDIWVETQEQCRLYNNNTIAWKRTKFKLKRALKRALKRSKTVNREN